MALENSSTLPQERQSVKFLSKLSQFILEYFDPMNIFLIMNMNDFQGDLNDISAKTATLAPIARASYSGRCFRY